VLSGLAILARLDATITVAACLAVSSFRRRDLKGSAQSAMAAAATVLPFLVWIEMLTGHVATTSAATKSLVVALDAEHSYGGKATLGYLVFCLRALGGQLARIAVLWV
jgi:hypothetical protein